MNDKYKYYVFAISLFFSLPALRTLWVTSQAKNNVRSTLASLHLPKSCTEAIMCILQIINCMAVRKRMENQGKLYYNHDSSIGVAAVGKKLSQNEAMSNSAKIKPIILAVIELSLSEGISKQVSG